MGNKVMPSGRRRCAFTLIELLVVMGIMVLMMTIAALGWRGMRRGAELRGATATVRTTLMLARQQAVLKRRAVVVKFYETGTNSYMEVEVGTNTPTKGHSRFALPPGVKFDPLPGAIINRPNGGAVGTVARSITMVERFGSPQGIGAVTLTNWPVTGVTE